MSMLKLLFSMSGRINRMTYIFSSLAAFILSIVLTISIGFAIFFLPISISAYATDFILLLSIYSQAALLTKRIRDTGKSTSLVWVYYITMVLGVILFFVGFLSSSAFLPAIIFLFISFAITLIAIFARSAPGGKSNSSALDSMAMHDPMANSQDNEEFNADADAMIARALERHEKDQQSSREDILRPVTRAAVPTQPVNSGGFGRRNTPAFGNR